MINRHALLLGCAILGAQAGPALAQGGVLMSCEPIGTRGSGENVETIYSQTCRPVVSGQVLRTETLSNGEIRLIYGGDRPALGGGPVYIMRFGDNDTERGNARYGAPLDGNPGTAGR